MEIQGDINNILKDIKKIEDKMSKTNKINKKLELLEDLYVLCHSYIRINGDSEIVLSDVPITKFQLTKSNEHTSRNNKILYDNFMDNRDFHREYAELISYELEAIINRFKYISLTKTKTKDDQKIRIVSHFYDEYDSLGTDILLELLLKNRVYKVDNVNEDNGYTVMLQSRKRSFLVINRDDKDYVYEMLSLVHEIGHNIDFDYLSKYGSKRIYDYYNFSVFTETLPYYYQVEFLNYLIDNKLNTNNSKYYFQELYDYINSYANNLLLLTDNNDINNIDELFNSTNYFYGPMIGIYLSNLRKNDPEKYKYIYKRLMNIRTGMFNQEQFDIIEFNHDTCLNALKEEAKILVK